MKYDPKQLDAVCDLYLKKSNEKAKTTFKETHVSEIAEGLALEEKYVWELVRDIQAHSAQLIVRTNHPDDPPDGFFLKGSYLQQFINEGGFSAIRNEENKKKKLEEEGVKTAKRSLTVSIIALAITAIIATIQFTVPTSKEKELENRVKNLEKAILDKEENRIHPNK